MTLNYDLNASYILENDHVLLRPLLESDYDNLLPFALNEPDTWVYSYRSARGEDGMRQYIKDALDNRAADKDYAFIVYDKVSQSYAGSTRFYDILPTWQTVQLGYTWYGERFRGTGLNKHCKYLMLQFAFDTLNAVRVEFRADARNERSIAAMKSIGCIPEGILRNNMPLQEGGRRDSIVLSILKEEWESTVKDLLKSKMSR